jgi:hypothetical protein
MGIIVRGGDLWFGDNSVKLSCKCLQRCTLSLAY